MNGVLKSKEGSVGELNGWWSKLFKIVLLLITLGFLPAVGWGVSMQIQLNNLRQEVKRAGCDRFSTQMYVDAQDMLEEKNRSVNVSWLGAKEIRELQTRYFQQK